MATPGVSFVVEGLVDEQTERSSSCGDKGLDLALDDSELAGQMHGKVLLPDKDNDGINVLITGEKRECVPLGMELRVRSEEDTVDYAGTKVEPEKRVGEIDIDKGHCMNVHTGGEAFLKDVAEPTEASRIAHDANSGNEVVQSGISNHTDVLAENSSNGWSFELYGTVGAESFEEAKVIIGKHANGCQISRNMVEENVEMLPEQKYFAVLTEATLFKHAPPVDSANEVRHIEEQGDTIERKRSATSADLQESEAGRIKKIVKLEGVDETASNAAENLISISHHTQISEAKNQVSNDCLTQTTNKDIKLEPLVCKESESSSVMPRTPRYKKRKIALFVAYCGVGYQGMQRNPGAVTIEGELEEALFKAGAIAESNFGDPYKVEWMRAARTDKGVSAVGQVVSGRFFIDPPGFVERVNSYLPNQIRVFGYKRVTNSFNAKNLCDRRRYEYVLPVFVFDPLAHLDRERMIQLEVKRKISLCSEKRHETEQGATDGHNKKLSEDISESSEITSEYIFKKGLGREDLGQSPQIAVEPFDEIFPKIENSVEAIKETTEIRDRLVIGKDNDKGVQDCRVSCMEESNTQEKIHGFSQKNDEEVRSAGAVLEQMVVSEEALKQTDFQFGEKHLSRFNSILRQYVGTHNFHNFTSRTSAGDPSAKRYIVSFEAGNVFKIGTMEFVKCKVVGQSFMLHQIRKMIGLAVAIMRGCAPSSMIENALRRDVKVNVPMAPELGLFLDECLYHSYNQKFQSSHEAVSLDDFRKEVEDFKWEQIYSHIASTEAREGVVALWLHSLNDRNYPDFVEERKKAQ